METLATAVASWGANRLDIFSLGTDNGMYHKAWNGSEWLPSAAGWEALGGVFDSPPAAVSWGVNRLDIFGLGTDDQMYHKAWNGSAWLPSATGWEALGGAFDSPPAVVSWGANRLDIFGLGTDNQMYHKAWNGSAWLPSATGWEALGGVFNSPPAVVSWGANRLDIFGLGTDNQMYHKAWNGSEWLPSATGWEALGGVFDSPPAAVSWGVNRLDIFGLGTDDQMYHKAWNGSEWLPSATGWEALGGVFDGAPAAVSWAANRLDIFGLGTDYGMYHKAWNGSAWLPSATGWEGLGGVFKVPLPEPSVPAPSAGLGSNSNYFLNSDCNPLTGLSVTINVAVDITGSDGFGFQVNAYSAKSDYDAAQQYLIYLDPHSQPPQLYCMVDNWTAQGNQVINHIVGLATLSTHTLPAGYKLRISLENDAGGNITGATYLAINNEGQTLGSQTITLLSLDTVSGSPVTTADLAPIVAFQLDFVDYLNGGNTTLSSGAGTIVYAASNPMTVLSSEPVCVDWDYITLETANSSYGLLPSNTSTTFVQTFQKTGPEAVIRKKATVQHVTRRPPGSI
jgi:hypothetical protein